MLLKLGGRGGYGQDKQKHHEVLKMHNTACTSDENTKIHWFVTIRRRKVDVVGKSKLNQIIRSSKTLESEVWLAWSSFPGICVWGSEQKKGCLAFTKSHQLSRNYLTIVVDYSRDVVPGT